MAVCTFDRQNRVREYVKEPGVVFIITPCLYVRQPLTGLQDDEQVLLPGEVPTDQFLFIVINIGKHQRLGTLFYNYLPALVENFTPFGRGVY